MEDHIISQLTQFKYIGSIILNDGEKEKDIDHQI